jgi:hypothetical protein
MNNLRAKRFSLDSGYSTGVGSYENLPRSGSTGLLNKKMSVDGNFESEGLGDDFKKGPAKGGDGLMEYQNLVYNSVLTPKSTQGRPLIEKPHNGKASGNNNKENTVSKNSSGASRGVFDTMKTKGPNETNGLPNFERPRGGKSGIL